MWWRAMAKVRRLISNQGLSYFCNTVYFKVSLQDIYIGKDTKDTIRIFRTNIKLEKLKDEMIWYWCYLGVERFLENWCSIPGDFKENKKQNKKQRKTTKCVQ